jgi:hypothetical protein
MQDNSWNNINIAHPTMHLAERMERQIEILSTTFLVTRFCRRS